jgi:hypothetical protein
MLGFSPAAGHLNELSIRVIAAFRRSLVIISVVIAANIYQRHVKHGYQKLKV